MRQALLARSTSWRDLASPREPPCSSSAVMSPLGESARLSMNTASNVKFLRCALIGAAALFFWSTACFQVSPSLRARLRSRSFRRTPPGGASQVPGTGVRLGPWGWHGISPIHLEGQVGRWGKDTSAYPPGRTKQHSASRCTLYRVRQDFRWIEGNCDPYGAVCVIPANLPHYVWARDGEVIYQEAGAGITRTIFIDQAASPR